MRSKVLTNIANKIEKSVMEKYKLWKPDNSYGKCDAVCLDKAFEIKGVIIKQSKRTGRAFIYVDNHEEFKKYAEQEKLKPYYIFAVYYPIDYEPVIITERIAEWGLVEHLKYGKKYFQISTRLISLFNHVEDVINVGGCNECV